MKVITIGEEEIGRGKGIGRENENERDSLNSDLEACELKISLCSTVN